MELEKQTPNLFRENPLFRPLARSSLANSIDRFIKSSLRLEHFFRLGGHFFIEKERELLKEVSRQTSYLSELCKEDPNSLVQERIKEILENFKKGVFHLGDTYLGSLRRDDEVVLKDVLRDLHEGKLPFEQCTEEDRQRYENSLRESLKAAEGSPSRLNQFWLKEWYDSGSWVQINYEGESPPFFPLMGVVLKEGRKIVIDIPGWREQNFPRQNEIWKEKTFPIANTLFYYEEQNPGDKETRTITCPKVEEIRGVHIPYPFSYPSEVSERHYDAIVKRKLRTILKRDAGLDKESLWKMSTYEALLRLMRFIDKKTSGEDVPGIEEMRIEDLIQCYTRDGRFPGTCKAMATLTASFCEALNIPARILEGQIIGYGGHMWAEVYLPTINKWVPVDPALGTFLTYPSEEVSYLLHGTVKPQKKRKINVRITYKDAVP